MPDILRFQPADRKAVDALYRRVFGHDAADANSLRWDWQYGRNPNTGPDGLPIWIAREGTVVIAHHGTMPVRLSVRGQEIGASWGMDAMVAPERQRQGLGEALFRNWDRQTGASLGLGLSDSSQRLFEKLRWPAIVPVPCLVKPLTRRAVRRPTWPTPANRIVSAVALPFIKVMARSRPLLDGTQALRRFDDHFTALWERLAGKFDLAVRRDAPYLNWKYLSPPHVRYAAVALTRGDEAVGYAVYRHVREPRGRVTLLVDFLADPGDESAIDALARWIDREARAADSDKIRTFVLHEGFRRSLKRAGYFQVRSKLRMVAKINAMKVAPDFWTRTGKWHVTLGDSDLDR